MHIPGRKNAAPDAMSRGVPGRVVVAALGSLSAEEEEIPCSEVRSHMLARLRMVIIEDLSQPDCELDASGKLLASMNNSIKSVT